MLIKKHIRNSSMLRFLDVGVMMRDRITQQTLELEILTKKSITLGKKLVNIF